ncbi:MAG TPA: hypothetical protein VF688_03395 [Allosphingosinicella sp.]|jgi:hypothetical protein
MIAAALLLAAAPYVDAYDSVLEAEFAAQDCERHYITHLWGPSSLSGEELWTEARRMCDSVWEDHRKARLAYHAKHRRSIRRRVPGFRPELDVCWRALESELNRWAGMPENTALRECKKGGGYRPGRGAR